MDLSTIRSRLTDFLNDSSTSRWSQTTRDAYINIAYHEVCNADNWPFREATDSTISTVSGTQAYNLPSAVNLPLGIWLDSIKSINKLGIVSREERKQFDYSSTARPSYYFRFASQIYLYPTPNQVFNLIIEYQKKITDLSATSDEPIFDADFHYLVPLRAASLLKRTSGGSDVNESQDLDDLYEEGIANMKARLLPRDLDRKKQVISVYDS